MVVNGHKKVVNIYIAHEINLWAYTQGADFTLGTFVVWSR